MSGLTLSFGTWQDEKRNTLHLCKLGAPALLGLLERVHQQLGALPPGALSQLEQHLAHERADLRTQCQINKQMAAEARRCLLILPKNNSACTACYHPDGYMDMLFTLQVQDCPGPTHTVSNHMHEE